MASRHARIQVPADPELEAAVARGRRLVGASAPASQVVRALALRGADALDQDEAARRRATDFLVSVAEGTSGLDLEGLRTVRARAWR
ncbi:MAG: hypothetical protein MSC31_08345 [Solirubrobacteraceae bacterium MAG38_C4-C5]|nr:hypothetical protein [Candidatus Siliceabacter maunaloa]